MSASPLDRANECLARVDARDAAVRAWAYLDPDRVRRQAADLSGQAPRSPLHGVTVGLKDIIETHDQPTAYGSSIWSGHQPDADAVAVELLRGAGLNIMGKTTTTEFATYHPTPTRNPHRLDRTPGGSSSGSAAAVADGQVDLALGTQTAGSVNRPGAFNGVFTLKPTYHRWPFTGVLPVALTFDTLGGFARDPRMLAHLDAVLAGGAAGSTRRPDRVLPQLASLRIGVLTSPWDDIAQPEALDALRSAMQAVRHAVAEVREVAIEDELADLQEAHANIQNYEAAFNLRSMITPAPEQVSDLLRRHLEAGAALSADQVQDHLVTLRRTRTFVGEAFERVDVLIALASPGEAPDLSSTGNPAFNRVASTAGVPAAGLPFGTGPSGLPLGLQIMAPHHSDRALLELVADLCTVLGVPTPTALPA